MEKIKVYGADWCPDCRRTKKYLEEQSVPFEYILVDEDKAASELVIELNKGKRIIPTVVTENEVYSNPSISKLVELFPPKK